MVLAGIYCDTAKPVLNSFVGSCIPESRSLYINGIKWRTEDGTEIPSKIVVLVCTVRILSRSGECKTLNRRRVAKGYGTSV